MIIKKILFPFSDKYKFLNNKRWHRFFRVLFYVIISILFLSFVGSLIAGDPIIATRKSRYNTSREYLIDTLIDNSFGDGKLACYEGGEYSDIYDRDIIALIDYYKGNVNSFFSFNKETAVSEYNINRLASVLQNMVEYNYLEFDRDYTTKTVNIVNEPISQFYYCIYGIHGGNDKLIGTIDTKLFFTSSKQYCGSDNVIAISITEYNKFFNEVAEKILKGEISNIGRNYLYKKDTVKIGSKIITSLPMDTKTSDLGEGCNFNNVLYYRENMFFYIENLLLYILTFILLILFLKILYYKLIIYIIYGDNIDGK